MPRRRSPAKRRTDRRPSARDAEGENRRSGKDGGIDPALVALRRRLRPWYRKHERALPWRQDRDPYRIWVSEIMLQQTRAEAVVPYYRRFLARFPDPAALAAAAEDDVLEHWAGLGYYRRGRNLWRAAREVVRDGGGLPKCAAKLQRLPGIGPYTAAAIGSIAFDEAIAVVDGNVERVLARYLGIRDDPRSGPAKTRIRSAAQEAVDPRAPGDHNQAVMELGATVCTPRGPRCPECPLRSQCRAHKLDLVETIPPPRAHRAREVQHWVAAVVRRSDGEILTVRAAADAPLLAGQFGLPIRRAPGVDAPPRGAVLRAARRLLREHISPPGRARRFPLEAVSPLAEVRHAITYRDLRLHGVVLDLAPPAGVRGPEARFVRDGRSLPALHRKVIAAASRVQLPTGSRHRRVEMD